GAPLQRGVRGAGRQARRGLVRPRPGGRLMPGWRWLPQDVLDEEKAQKVAQDWADQQRAQLAQAWADMHRRTADALLTLYGPEAAPSPAPVAPATSFDREMLTASDQAGRAPAWSPQDAVADLAKTGPEAPFDPS